MKVLVADDHPIIRLGVAGVLSLGGITDVVFAVDGQDALEVIVRERPDIAILDVRMPRLDGLGVVREMVAQGATAKVILLTAELSDEQLLEALRCDVRAILFKDGAEDRMLDCVRRVEKGEKYIDTELTDRALRTALLPKRDFLDDLTPRERQLVKLVGLGLRNREIASQLAITEGTVKVYLSSIYLKLGINNRTALALLIMSSAH